MGKLGIRGYGPGRFTVGIYLAALLAVSAAGSLIGCGDGDGAEDCIDECVEACCAGQVVCTCQGQCFEDCGIE